MRRPPRRAARRTGRTTARRTTRRVMRRRRRRRIMVGGMVVLAASGTAAAIKMSQQDAQRVEQHAGAPVEELNEEELSAAMKDLNIQTQPLDENDQAALAEEESQSEYEPSYLEELEKLAALRDQGIISDIEFEAKKAQLLNL